VGHDGGSERTSHSRQLGEFLIELSIALNRMAMYPPGHPSLEESARAVVGQLSLLLGERTSLSLGVARQQLIIEGVATDAGNPVLRALAQRLHGHHIGAVTFERGVETAELLAALRLMAADNARGEEPLGLGDPARLRVGPHVRLYPLTYDQLQLIESDGAEAADREAEDASLARLWIGLARAALAKGGDAELEPEQTDPDVVAQAIREHPKARAYDQVIVGYLLQIAQQLRQGGGIGAASLRRRMSRLVGALDGETLERLVEMGGDAPQRQRFLLDAADGLAADAVLDLVRSAAAVSGQTISSSMLRILGKMSSFAEAGEGRLQERADSELRDHVRTLITGWSLEDPNPGEYTAALDAMSKADPLALMSVGERYPPEPMRVLQMALESGAEGPSVDRAIATVVETRELPQLLGLLDVAFDTELSERIWRRLAQPQGVRSLLDAPSLDVPTIERLLSRMDVAAAARVLLDALLTSPDRTPPRELVAMLVSLGPRVAPLAAARLREGAPLHEARQLLSVLHEVGIVPDGFAPLAWARHEDALIRRNALGLAVRVEQDRERALALALSDPDPRVVRVAARAAMEGGVPGSVLPVLTGRLGDEALPMDLRVALVRVLRDVPGPTAVEALVRVATTGRTWFGRLRLAGKTPELLAAVSVLSERGGGSARAEAVLRRARASGDLEIRQAASAARLGPVA
jgi:hypothetical protein